MKNKWYCRCSKEFLPTDIVDEVSFGTVDSDISMTWHQLMNAKLPTPRIDAFNDSWRELFLMKDLLEKLSENTNIHITPDQFIEILKNLGFEEWSEEND